MRRTPEPVTGRRKTGGLRILAGIHDSAVQTAGKFRRFCRSDELYFDLLAGIINAI